ncbi:MAG: hypothetical protein ABRQ25_18960 [Clostridiaceae bacterium]
MKTMKMAALNTLYYILTFIFAVVIALTTIIAYFSLQSFLFGRGGYLLFVSNTLNMIPILMIVILIIYNFARIKEKFFIRKEKQIIIMEEDEEPVDIETLSKLEKVIFKLLNKFAEFDDTITKIFNMIKICYISVLIIAIYFGMTSYAILYADSIKVSSPVVPAGVIYKYSDIKNINVGVSKGYNNSYSPYYKVVFNDDKSVDFFGGSMHEDKDIGFEYILIDLDKKLRTKGVLKSVDKENFEEYSKGLGKDFVGRVERLFDYN